MKIAILDDYQNIFKEIIEIDNDINSKEFAEVCAHKLLELIKQGNNQ